MPRPTVAEISLSALQFNFREIQKHTGHTPICAMVKADAYGHDALAVARELSAHGVTYWGVHSIEEARQLRGGAIGGEILVLGGVQGDDMRAVQENRVTPALHSSKNLKDLTTALPKNAALQHVHLKLDTGMGRLGVRPEELDRFLAEFKRQKVLQMTGVFAHLPSAEKTEFTHGQGQVFESCLKKIRDAGIDPGLRHHSNSVVSILYPDLRYDLVRPGLILYGIYPNDLLRPVLHLKPVMTFASRIISVREVPAGEGLSYGHTFVTQRPSKIATIPVGYADGYPRLASNKASVLIRGKRFPIVGRVCMDMSLIDVTDEPGIDVGERVVMFGTDQDQTLSVQELADFAGTIPYEILCGISPRVPRLFL